MGLTTLDHPKPAERCRAFHRLLLLMILACLAAAPAFAQRETLVKATDSDDADTLASSEIGGMHYIGATYVWVAFYTGQGNRNGFGLEGTSVRTLYLNAVNGAADSAKVRVHVFDENGQLLLFPGDQTIASGQSAELIDPLAYYLNPANLIEGLPDRVTIVVASDEPIALFAHEQDFNHARHSSGQGTSEHASDSKRHVPFERVDCPSVGREWFCAAPISELPWDVWHVKF